MLKRFAIASLLLLAGCKTYHYNARTFVEHTPDHGYCVYWQPQQDSTGLPDSSLIGCDYTLDQAYSVSRKMDADLGVKK